MPSTSASDILVSLLLAITPLITKAQQIGPSPEVHPRFPTQKCAKDQGCIPQNTSLVLDANYRKINSTLTGQPCLNTTSGSLNTTICPDTSTCASTCAVDGISDYESHGVFVKDNSVTLRQWLNIDGAEIPSFPRIYLFNEEEKEYVSLQLLDQEFSFTVDVSNLPCGQNGALFLSAMEKDGGKSDLNPAGAEFGTGYCDAGCPKSAWINGVANINGSVGACCAELDIWEANSGASAFALHPCKFDGVFECDGDQCEGVCASSGCGYNTYELGEKDFYGLGKVLDTRKPFTVVTRFVAEEGELIEVKQIYVQDGKVIESPEVDFGYGEISSANGAYCAANSPKLFSELGGVAQMGKALESGMVPILCIWNRKSFVHLIHCVQC